MYVERKHYLGIDIGGTNIVYGVISADGQLIKEKSTKTNLQRGANQIIQELLAISQAWIEEDSLITTVGIGLPGLVDNERGIARVCPNLQWIDVDIRSSLQTGLKAQIYLENDVRCMALAERRFGALRGTENGICIALGTGVGSGIFVRGELLQGANGGAGEVGHMTILPVGGERCRCGNTGCWETLVSASSIIRQARYAMEHALRSDIATILREPLDGKRIADAAREGDPVACAVIEEAGRFLGIGLSNLINLFDPECIVFGGGMALAGDVLFLPARKELLRRGMPTPMYDVRIVSAELDGSAGVIGAALLGLLKEGEG